MKRKKQLVFASFLMISGTVGAQDVYVYKDHVYTPALQMQDVQRIAFGSEGIDVVGKDGSKQSVLYEAFDYLRFYATPVGVERIPANGVRTIYYSTTGVRMGDGKKALEDLPAGVYIEKETRDGKEQVKKILKK